MKRQLLLLNLIAFILIFISCKNDEENPTKVADPKPVADPGFSVSKNSITFTHLDSIIPFYVKNEGNTMLTWKIDPSSPFLKFEPSSGEIKVSDSVKIDVIFDKSKLSEGIYDGSFYVSIPALIPHGIEVTGVVYKEKKWVLNEALVDAEYDGTHDVIVALTANTQKLLKINPETKEIEELDIKIKGNCISLSKDGKYAVIGHNFALSYVNIETMQIEKSLGLSLEIKDVVLAPNNWIYLFPGGSNMTKLISVKIGSWEEHSSSFSIKGGSIARLHPSGSYIFSAETNTIPSLLDKFDLTNGPAEFLHNSENWRQKEFSGNVFISEDGNHLFGADGHIFTYNAIKEEDIKFIKKLAGDGKVATLDHSTMTGLVFATFDNPVDFTSSQIVRKYDGDFNLINSYALPGFIFTGPAGNQILGTSEPHLGFFNSAGTKYFLLVSPGEYYTSYSSNWALVTYPGN